MTTLKTFDVAIVGGGAIGAAALHFAAKLGNTNTVLLEQKPEFANGATGAWGSLLRQYSSLPFYNEYSPAAFRYYREDFKRDTGVDPMFRETGALYFTGPRQAGFREQVASIQKRSSFPIEILDASLGGKRFPGFQWFEGDTAVYEPSAGILCPFAVTNGWIDAAGAHGAQARTNARVVEILTTPGRVNGVRLATGEIIKVEKLVLAAGPWTRTLLEPLGIELPLLARPLQLNRFRNEKGSESVQQPFFLDGTAGTFGRPMSDGSFLGGYILEEEAKPSQFHQPLKLSEAAEAKRRLSKRLKGLRTASLVGGVRALESYTVDEKPVLQYAAKFENLFIAAGWCCTGFSLAPVFGLKIAHALLESRDSRTKVKSNSAGLSWHQIA